MNIVIIGHNEGEYVNNMLVSLKERYPRDKRIWILDRCTDSSEDFLKKHGEFFINTPTELEGRQTSYSRNLGLYHTDSEQDVMFLDGDRYFIEGKFDPINWNYDIGLFKLTEDSRDIIIDYKDIYGTVHNGFYSCGLFMKRSAIEKVKAFQNGELFKLDIQTDWGIEDMYLGDVCYHLGLTCDIHPTVRLQGCFNKSQLDNLDILEKRFKLRDKLNVKW